MKKGTKLFVALIAVMMFAVMFAGCSAAPEASEPAAEPAAEPVAEEEPAEETPAEPAEEPAEETEYVIAPKNGEKHVIGFSVTEIGTTVMQTLKMFIENTCEEYGFDLTIAVCDNSTEKQIADVESFITSDVDLVIMLPFNSEGAAPAVKALNEAEIPCICVLRNVLDVDYLCTVKHDSYLMGQLAGQKMGELLNGKGKVIEIVGAPGVSNSEITSSGFHDGLAAYPDVEIIATQPGFYQAAKAQDAMDSILGSVGNDFDGVYVQNGDMTTGTYLSMKNNGIDTSTKIFIGGNWLAAAAERIEAGEQTADITTPMDEMGRIAVELADDYFRGEELADFDIPVDVVTKENMEDFMYQIYTFD
jgi:ribose transport system substrate-binding protein